MTNCPAGHNSETDDYCSRCGIAIGNSDDSTRKCPICGAAADLTAFFCEECGYDFLTGARPRDFDSEDTEHSSIDLLTPWRDLLNEDSAAVDQDQEPSLAEPSVYTGPAAWVAEIWIDPEWYRLQKSTDQLPSPGPPMIIGLRLNQLIVGRYSPTHKPNIQCGADNGVSRRHALLSTDGKRWFIEDLGSSNGTYIGQVDKPLPTEPITSRVELDPHDRVYLGSWTRLVVRPALLQEADL